MRLLSQMMGEDPPEEKKPKKVKQGKVLKTYGHSKDAQGKRTAKADLDTGEKGVDVVWSDDAAAWQVPGSSAQEGQRFDIKQPAEITADRDRSQVSEQGIPGFPVDSDIAPPPPVKEQDVSKKLRRSIARSMPLKPSDATNHRRVSWPGGTAFVPAGWTDFPATFKSEDEFLAAEKKRKAESDSKEDAQDVAAIKKGWVAMRNANGLPTDDASWRAYYEKHYAR